MSHEQCDYEALHGRIDMLLWILIIDYNTNRLHSLSLSHYSHVTEQSDRPFLTGHSFMPCVRVYAICQRVIGLSGKISQSCQQVIIVHVVVLVVWSTLLQHRTSQHQCPLVASGIWMLAWQNGIMWLPILLIFYTRESEVLPT